MPSETDDEVKSSKHVRAARPAVELRSVVGEVRMVTGDDGRPRIRGYGLVFNSPSAVITEEGDDGQPFKFREIILPGFAKRSLAEGDLRVLAHHDPAKILGRRSAGTAKFGQDEFGVWYEVDPPNASYARDLIESMNRGDMDGSSFSFATIRDKWSDGPDAEGVHTRTLHDGHVFEMGPVSWPAYKGARAAYRSAAPTPTPIVYPTPEQVRLLNLLRLAELA